MILILVIAATLDAQTVRILTSQYNNNRTGSNENEVVLTSEKVNVLAFGKLAALSVDGAVYAQPLYLPALVPTL
jgi:hypothetical protein